MHGIAVKRFNENGKITRVQCIVGFCCLYAVFICLFDYLGLFACFVFLHKLLITRVVDLSK